MTILEKLYNGEISPCETAVPTQRNTAKSSCKKIKLRKN